MKILLHKFLNVFVAVTLAAFIMSAFPMSSMASETSSKSQFFQADDGHKAADHSQNGQEDGECDDGCCFHHYCCAGYAIPRIESYTKPLIGSLAVQMHQDQKSASEILSPQLRPPRILA